MDEDTFLVLRMTGVESDAGWSREVLGPSVRGTYRGMGPLDSEYQVEEETLNAEDYEDLQRDPEVKAIVRPMPLRLIAPVEGLDDAKEIIEPEPIEDATWGVYVTGALRSAYDGSGVVVAVLDTGIDARHEAFTGITLVQRDFTGEGDGDSHGHGTHVAGTIFGQTVGKVRYGIAPGVRRALIGKVLGKKKSATTTELVKAIQWAVDEGANVINMSLGIDFPGLVKRWVEKVGLEPDLATSRALAQYRDNIRLFDSIVAIQQARVAFSSGALIVAAAGNESKRKKRSDYAIEVSPPAAAVGIVSVAALQTSGTPHDKLSVASFSNIRAMVSAPGVGIYSALANKDPNAYTYMSGTSMASPHVAGIAALWAERQLGHGGEVSATALASALIGRASLDRLPEAKYSDVGEGLVIAPLQ